LACENSPTHFIVGPTQCSAKRLWLGEAAHSRASFGNVVEKRVV
jgi:hypothetical protein